MPLACAFLANGNLVFAMIFMGLAELTDGLDGWVARKGNRVSDVGKLLDPLCDSVFHMAIWMSFLSLGWAPLYLVILFFARDAIVSTIRSCLAKNGIILGARWSGKIKAVAQATAQLSVVFLHILLKGNALEIMQIVLISAAAAVTAWSLLDYSWCFYGHVKSKKVVLA
jgi:CDP-diacylglycerol--glycerol-3-phosphate 3-phosphatidyltransferase